MRVRSIRKVRRVAATGELPKVRSERPLRAPAAQHATRGTGTMSADGLSISSERTGTTVRITASGEIDLLTAPQLRKHTTHHFGDHAEIVVLDLTGVTFIDSTGLHVLLQAADDGDGRLRIVPGAACLHLVDVVGVRGLLPLIDSDPRPA
jgi:anti-sigma B factor antagonist